MIIRYDLYARWRDLCKKGDNCTQEAIDLTFRNLCESYLEPHRWYHDLSHLYNMFNMYDDIQHLIQNNVVVEFAIWFHDMTYSVGYVPNKPAFSNEANSAASAMNWMDFLGFDDSIYQETGRLISLTTHTDGIDPRTEDAKYFLDLDLAILGSDWDTYYAYSNCIRKEYSFFEDKVFNPGRIKVLKNILEMPHIYHTDLFRQKYEANARLNIAAELDYYETR